MGVACGFVLCGWASSNVSGTGLRAAEAGPEGLEIRAALGRRTKGPVPAWAIGGIRTKWFGELRVRDWGLALFTIVIGLLDGFSPCAMWVLLFLLSLLVNLRDRLKMADIFDDGLMVAMAVSRSAAENCGNGQAAGSSSLAGS